ncbi:transposase [Sinorhizobium mexicanum]|uniref:transposase n=1 Tax=Sinorhizobium mexicanum TaxID=375549 RepID=UPI003CC90A86
MATSVGSAILKSSLPISIQPQRSPSGEGPAYHGRITKQGRGHAWGMLVEAAWAVARSTGPLRDFYKRIASRHTVPILTSQILNPMHPKYCEISERNTISSARP